MRKKLLTLCLATVLIASNAIPVQAAATQKNEAQNNPSVSYNKGQVIEENSSGSITLPDNETLQEGYICEAFGLDSDNLTLFDSIDPEEKLDTINLSFYNILKEKIADVAAGSTSSTAFVIPYSAVENFYGVGLDINAIMDVMGVNCPYELYWYDKTVGVGLHGDGYDLTFSFAVAKDYAGSEEYSTNTEKTSVVTNAVANANAIVSEHADENDYAKLLSYKNEICDRVSYNDDAMDDSYTGGYGDPWQLVYVFDDDEETNVVCEGYSKAFQYLCDHSTFQSSLIKSRLISGILTSSSGSGGHMWNIVTMNDGENYLVDVTNCDNGTAGYPNQLFLVGTEGSVADGYQFTMDSGKTIRYTYKSDTTDLYKSVYLTLSDSAYEYAPDAECTHSKTEIRNAREATCGEDGYTGDTYCVSCGKLLSEGESIDETDDHDWVDGHITLAPTCVSTGIKKYTCSVCGATGTQTLAIDPENHTGETYVKNAVDATCVSDGYTGDSYCQGCDSLLSEGSTIPATGIHSWNGGEVTKEATEGETGIRTYTCTVCGTTKTEDIEKLPHTHTHVWDAGKITTPASCASTGVKTYTCSECGEMKTESIAKDPANHTGGTYVANAVAASCGANGYTGDTYCKGCNAKLSSGNAIAATGVHSWDNGTIMQAPTVFTSGIMIYRCNGCGASTATTMDKLTPSIKLSATKKTIKKKKTYTLVISGLAAGDSIKSVKTSKKAVATLKKSAKDKYKITAKKKGTSTITVMLKSGKKATCKITVK